jgi:hypothetical protein
MRKSPRTPLYQRGADSSLWQREVRRDFIINICIFMNLALKNNLDAEINSA